MILPRKLNQGRYIEKAAADIKITNLRVSYGNFFPSLRGILFRHLTVFSGFLVFSAPAIADEWPALFEMTDEECLISAANSQRQNGSILKAPSSTTDPIDLSRLGAALAIDGKKKKNFATLLDAIRILHKAHVMLVATGNDDQIAATGHRLGYTLLVLGRLQGDDTVLEEAVETFRHTLDKIDRERKPAHAALTEQCLAFGLMTWAAMGKDQARLSAASDRYHRAADLLDKAGEREQAGVVRRRLEQVRTLLATLSPPTSTDYRSDAVSSSTTNQPLGVGAESHDRGLEILLSGSLQVAVVTVHDEHTDDDESGHDPTVTTEAEVEISAEYETDQGVEYSARLSLVPGTAGDPTTATAVLYFSNGFGELRFGQDSGAEDDMYVGSGDFQAGTGGIDGSSANLIDVGLTGSGDAIKVSYFTPRIDGFQLGTSYTPYTGEKVRGARTLDDPVDGNIQFDHHVGLGINWVSKFDHAEIIAAAVASSGNNQIGPDLESYSIGSGITISSLEFGAGYTIETEFNDRSLFNLGTSYGFDPMLSWAGDGHVGAGVAFLFPNDGPNRTVLALSGDLYLAPGLQLLADIAYSYQDQRSEDEDRSALSSVIAIEFNY